MPEVARGHSQDTVSTNHGCDSVTVTDECSSRMIVENFGVVRKGDLNKIHLVGSDSCVPHQVPLTTHSARFFVEERELGRKGDEYSGETITSGSSRFFVEA